jgi:hypothetical protein
VVREPAHADASQSSAGEEAVVDDSHASEEEEEGQHDEWRQTSVSVGQFGIGALDGYEFNKEISVNSKADSVEGGDGGEDEQLEDSAQQPSHARIFSVSHDSSPPDADDVVVQRRRKKSVSSASSMRTSMFPSFSTQNPPSKASLLVPTSDHVLSTPKRGQVSLEGKRPRTSPIKDPTPKRRRTLHKSDIAYATVEQSSALESVN